MSLFEFNPAFPDATNEQKWDQIRLWRDAELVASDWTMLSDAPVNQNEWLEYRKALRNCIDLTKNADDFVLLNKPSN